MLLCLFLVITESFLMEGIKEERLHYDGDSL